MPDEITAEVTLVSKDVFPDGYIRGVIEVQGRRLVYEGYPGNVQLVGSYPVSWVEEKRLCPMKSSV